MPLAQDIIMAMGQGGIATPERTEDAALAIPSGWETGVTMQAELVVCPSCGCQDCAPLSTTEARFANCPECEAEFALPEVTLEGRARRIVTTLLEGLS